MADEKKIPATPVPAATVLLIRDTDDGIEVFMVERSNRMHFASALVSRAVSSTRKTLKTASCPGAMGSRDFRRKNRSSNCRCA